MACTHRDTIEPQAERDVTVRLAAYSDSPALLRLAGLDSAVLPGGPLVLAEVGGEVVAALALESRRAIADPFRHTAALLEMLNLRAEQIRRESRAPARRGLLPRRLRSRLAASGH